MGLSMNPGLNAMSAGAQGLPQELLGVGPQMAPSLAQLNAVGGYPSNAGMAGSMQNSLGDLHQLQQLQSMSGTGQSRHNSGSDLTSQRLGQQSASSPEINQGMPTHAWPQMNSNDLSNLNPNMSSGVGTGMMQHAKLQQALTASQNFLAQEAALLQQQDSLAAMHGHQQLYGQLPMEPKLEPGVDDDFLSFFLKDGGVLE